MASPDTPHEGTVASFDGTRIVWRLAGPAGAPVLACHHGLSARGRFFTKLEDHFSERYRVLTYDMRGHGDSARPSDIRHLRVLDLARDFLAVLAAVEAERGPLGPLVHVGHSMGVKVALEAAHLVPEPVAGLVALMGGHGPFRVGPLGRGGIPATWPVSLFGRLIAPAWRRTLEATPRIPLAMEVARRLYGHPDLLKREDFAALHDMQARIDADVFLTLTHESIGHDAGHAADRLEAPALVMAAERDRLAPPEAVAATHRRIRDAEWMLVRRSSHAAPLEQPELIHLRMEKFLRERVASTHA